jgi:hypothetical protein
MLFYSQFNLIIAVQTHTGIIGTSDLLLDNWDTNSILSGKQNKAIS